MAMKESNVLNLIKKGESQTLEFKSSLSDVDKILHDLCGFANTDGGVLLVGASDSGRIMGTNIGKNTVKSFTNKISQGFDPKLYPKIGKVRVANKDLLFVEIKDTTNKPYQVFGKAFKRVDKSTLQMYRDEFERMILEKHREKIRFDSQICEDARVDDIDRKKVNWYLKKRQEIRKIKKPEGMTLEEVLMNVDGAKRISGRIRPTNAGILFFGKNPQRFFVQSQLRVVRFKGTRVIDQVIDRLDCFGTLPEMTDQAEEFIRKNIRLLSFRTEKSFAREDKFEYPIRALREGIINALIHRDYDEPADVRVFIFDDRVEIINPGSFPRDVTPEKPIHKPVNPILSALMYDVGFIEKYRSGIYMMKELCKKWENKEPYYDLHPIETKLIFESQINEEMVVPIEEKILKTLNERQRKAIEYIEKTGFITNKIYRELNHVSHKTAHLELHALIKSGLVNEVGKGSAVKYVMKSG